ncbi:MAG: hypothetical protein HC904_04675 [Blastochloris sp.]|nr:hypothetical protein [Blastochloris sp.]
MCPGIVWATAWPIVVFAWLAINPRRAEEDLGSVGRSRWWRGWGVFFMVVGVLGLWQVEGGWSRPGQLKVNQTLKQVAGERDGPGEREALLAEALTSGPLRWQIYFWRAGFRVQAGDEFGARDDFRRARFLEKQSPLLPLQEALLWMPRRTDLALAAVDEMIRRSNHGTESRYNQVLDEAKRQGNLEMLEQMPQLARRHPHLNHYYLAVATEEEFDGWIGAEDGAWSESGELWFWHLMRERKSQEWILNWLLSRPPWLRRHYAVAAELLSEQGRVREAYELRRRYMPKAILPDLDKTELSPSVAQKRVILNPSDFAANYVLVQEELQRKEWAQALKRSEEVLKLEGAPAYFQYLRAMALAELEKWEEADQALRQYELEIR